VWSGGRCHNSAQTRLGIELHRQHAEMLPRCFALDSSGHFQLISAEHLSNIVRSSINKCLINIREIVKRCPKNIFKISVKTILQTPIGYYLSDTCLVHPKSHPPVPKSEVCTRHSNNDPVPERNPLVVLMQVNDRSSVAKLCCGVRCAVDLILSTAEQNASRGNVFDK
jgi:hypothetical protein